MSAAQTEWTRQLPDVVAELAKRWSLTLGPPFSHRDVTCSWVAPAVRRNQRFILKIGMPHMEADHEIAGLRFWNGDPTVRLFDADDALNAMLLEECIPGTSLRTTSNVEQDRVITKLLHRLWRVPVAPHPFRHLSVMIEHWCNETRASEEAWGDATLVREGLDVFARLSATRDEDVLLATDLHAGNVLAAQRQPWLVIDPKPFIGDAAYDITQHLFNTGIQTDSDPKRRVAEVAALTGVDATRARLWLFARAAAEPRDAWDADTTSLARRLAR